MADYIRSMWKNEKIGYLLRDMSECLVIFKFVLVMSGNIHLTKKEMFLFLVILLFTNSNGKKFAKQTLNTLVWYLFHTHRHQFNRTVTLTNKFLKKQHRTIGNMYLI